MPNSKNNPDEYHKWSFYEDYDPNLSEISSKTSTFTNFLLDTNSSEITLPYYQGYIYGSGRCNPFGDITSTRQRITNCCTPDTLFISLMTLCRSAKLQFPDGNHCLDGLKAF
jgi:hypothetical protein